MKLIRLLCLFKVVLPVRVAYGLSSSSSSNKNLASSSQLYPMTKSRRVIFQSGIASAFGLGSAWLLTPSEARAERTLTSVTESYNRYVPRMIEGFRYLNDTMPVLIREGDENEVIREISAEKGTTISAMKGTMRIFATAFSDSVITQSTRELQLAALKTSNELDNVASALKADDKVKALEAQSQAIFYAQVYSELANMLLPLKTDPIPGPIRTSKRFKEVDNSVNGAF